MTRRFLLLTGLAAVLVVPQHSVSAAKPRSNNNMTDLGTLGGPYSGAFGINNDPALVRVVGWSHIPGRSGAYHAFYWVRGGPMTDLGTLGGNVSQAYDVNNYDQVVGTSRTTAAQSWGTVWSRSGGVWGSERLPSSPDVCCTSALGISNGQAGDSASVVIVGGSPVGATWHAARWTKVPLQGWVVQTLGTLVGDTSSAAYGVNDHGAIVGVSQNASNVGSGFHWSAATGMVILPSRGGDTYATAINNNGEVAGFSADATGNRHAVRWIFSANGGWALEDLGTLGGCCSEGAGINIRGDVVGYSHITSRAQHAFLASPGSQGLTDLGALGRSSAAWDVNDANVVVGESGSNHAVVWN